MAVRAYPTRHNPALLSRRNALGMALGTALAAAVTTAGCSPKTDSAPLKVVLIPADGGTQTGTLADFQPIFDAISQETGLTFELRVAQSYSTAVEAMCAGHADIAFLGPATFVQAKQRNCADFLAAPVKNGASIYYSGLFVRAGSSIRTIEDVRGHSVAFGDLNSTSSFLVPIGMLMDAGIDPARDLSKVALLDSHASTLAALSAGQIDVAALSFESFDKAVANGTVKPDQIRVIARSAPIPFPPFAVNHAMAEPRKQMLRTAFDNLSRNPNINPALIRGYGGQRVEGYRSDLDPETYVSLIGMTDRVTPQLKSELVAAATRR